MERVSKNALLGIILVFIGIAYLLSNLGLIPDMLSGIIFSWQSLVILFGMAALVRGRYVIGLVLIAVGGVYMLNDIFEMMNINFLEPLYNIVLWPAVIIFFGLWLIFHKKHEGRHKNFGSMHSASSSVDGKVNYDLFMNGIDEVFLEPLFKGGEINTIMGGVKLDLRKTKLPEGETVLKVSSVFGGVTLFVPMDWNVVVKSDSILGGFVDHRHGNGTYVDRSLVIEANLLMGGGSIE